MLIYNQTKRLCRFFCISSIHRNAPSSTQIAYVLRPFIFRVHPDLFGKFPYEQKINESSLQKMNEYISGLQIDSRVKSTELHFYLRELAGCSADEEEKLLSEPIFKEINIHLKCKSINETLRSILQSAAIPLKDLDGIIKNLGIKAQPKSRTIDWGKSFCDLYGFKNERQFGFAKNSLKKPYLDLWLKKNSFLARKHQQSSAELCKAIDDLKQTIHRDFGIVSIEWESRWSSLQLRICLSSFKRFLNQFKNDDFLKIISGKAVIFIQEANTGLDLNGNILLRIDDVIHHWYQIISAIPQQEMILGKIDRVEKDISRLLNGIQIFHSSLPRILVSEDYLKQLLAFRISLINLFEVHRNWKFDLFLQDVQIIFNPNARKISLNTEGQIMIPYHFDGKNALKYIIGNSILAQNQKKKNQTKIEKKNDYINHLVEIFDLQSLKVEYNISLDQLEVCYQDLLLFRYNVTAFLNKSQLNIAYFYQIQPDGTICIPWNWKC